MKHKSDKGSSCSEFSKGLPISLKGKAKVHPKPCIPRLHDTLLVSPALVLTHPALLTEAYFLFLKHASTLLPQDLCIGLPCLERSLVARSFFSLTSACPHTCPPVYLHTLFPRLTLPYLPNPTQVSPSSLPCLLFLNCLM